MYKPITKDEIIVMILMFSFAVLYRILDDFAEIHFSGKHIIAVAMIFVGYLLFNRQIKFIVNLIRKRKLYYSAVAEITDIKKHTANYVVVGGKYSVFVIQYQDLHKKICTQELHNFFSIREIKTGQKINLKINCQNSDDMIVMSSDIFLFLFYCVSGIIVESVLMMLLINIC